MDTAGWIELAKGIYWVGIADRHLNLSCNPYLLVDGEEAILIDPGNVLDFAQVYAKVTQLVSIEQIKYVILHHQDPDLCASVPLFEQKGARFQIVTHWRTQMLVQYYGVQSEYYIVNKHQFRLTLQSGRELRFLPTPYLHFPGAIATYDPVSRILFSSDIFGALSFTSPEWSLFANADYMERMKTFHENYIPSNDILRPVMEMFRTLDIAMIAPQHGSVINREIDRYILALRDLHCGYFLKPVRRFLAHEGGYLFLCSQVLRRYAAIFGPAEVRQAIDSLDLLIDETTWTITEDPGTRTNDSHDLWDRLFEQIAARKGMNWLLVVEPLITQMAADYDIPMPRIFAASIHASLALNEEVRHLKLLNQELANRLTETQDRLSRDKVTGLYNFEFFRIYVINALENNAPGQETALVVVNIDQMARIRFTYGDAEVDHILQITAAMIQDLRTDQTLLFRLQGAAFAALLPAADLEQAIAFAEQIRNRIAGSERYIEAMTVSIGVVSFTEPLVLNSQRQATFEAIYGTGMKRVSQCRRKGENLVCSRTEPEDEAADETAGKVLLVDSDEVSVDILRTALENLRIQVLTARDGVTAVQLAERELPDVIISEITLPKQDGFVCREKMLANSATKNIPFIVLSYLKNEHAVRRALSLDIEHYLRKPFMLSELVGLVQLKIRDSGERWRS